MPPSVPALQSSARADEASRSDSAPAPASGLGLSLHWLDGGTALVDQGGRTVAVNEALAAWLGSVERELTGQLFWERLWKRAPQWQATVEPALAAATPLHQVRLRGEAADGTPQFFDLELAVNPAGTFVRLGSTLPPLSELTEASWDEHLRSEAARRQMFMRLLRAEAQLENLVHRWPGVIFTQRADFSFQFASPGVSELTGVPVAEWHTQPQRFWQIVHEADGEELQAHLKRCVQQKRTLATTFRIRHAKTGRVAYVLEHRQALVGAGGLVLGYEGVWLDVTRQIIAEKRLSSAAWKETLAVLTMGLAHDFSNIMAGIVSLSESFLAQVGKDHPFQEGLSLIKQNSFQAHQLVHRIIHLHHGKTGTNDYCDLNEVVRDLVDLVHKILPRRIDIRTELSSEPLSLYVDSVEFRQVIINLTLNAAEAMPQGGQLTLRTSLHSQLPEIKNLRGAWPRLPAVCLAVHDTGCGIKTRHLSSIFDPFFTTKPMNKGSGLGLYNTRLFVERHRGMVSVESVEGVGNTFFLWLPQADFSEAERGLTKAVARRRSVLVVGRADTTLDSTAEFLRCHGYHVVVATTPANAMDLLESGEYQCVGLIIVLEREDIGLASLIPEVRAKKLPIKTVLQLVGCHSDDLDGRVLQQTDLVITADLPETEILHRLDTTLPAPEYEPATAL